MLSHVAVPGFAFSSAISPACATPASTIVPMNAAHAIERQMVVFTMRPSAATRGRAGFVPRSRRAVGGQHVIVCTTAAIVVEACCLLLNAA
jgi:hypothetical protein